MAKQIFQGCSWAWECLVSALGQGERARNTVGQGPERLVEVKIGDGEDSLPNRQLISFLVSEPEDAMAIIVMV